MAPRSPSTQIQALLAVDSIHAFPIDVPALTSKQNVDPKIAIAHPRLGDFAYAESQGDIVHSFRSIAMARASDPNDLTCAALADSIGVL
jgi:hypothetical protein